LLGHVEDGYKAAAALEALAGWPSTASVGTAEFTEKLSADEALQAVTAFQLGGGLRLGSVHYASPGFLTFIGALNPLKTLTDGITANREINTKRDETRGLDEREREQYAMRHEEAMAQESRWSEQQRQDHDIQVARLQMEAERARFEAMNALLDRLPRAQQSTMAADLLQRLVGSAEAIANDARVDGARMLELPDASPSAEDPDPTA
jgi:hypothetical protein